MEKYWQLDVKQTSEQLKSDSEKGLTALLASERLAQYGPNRLQEAKGVSPVAMFFAQFNDFIVWVLIGAALVSGFLQEWIDAGAIIGIVIVNAILGFIQEYRAEKSLAALKKLSSPNSKVIRNGEHQIIPSSELVPGDIIEIEAGDHIGADSRVVWATSNFSVQEASLTGESSAVVKNILPIDKAEVPLGDRVNLLYMGTSVVSGKARAMVYSTGMSTELGKIAGMIQNVESEDTPLQKKLEQFGKWIVVLCFILVALVFTLGLLRGGHLLEMFLTSVSLAVAAIPEGLPAVVTIALALGVQRMVKRHALIRKLPSVETLGCATVICSDKTGTLTRNEMTVQAVYISGDTLQVTGVGYEPKGDFYLASQTVGLDSRQDLKSLLDCALVCNGATLTKSDTGYRITGDPTEAALLVAAGKLGLDKKSLEKQYPFVEEIPFDSDRKLMTVICKSQDGFIAFTKGAPDILLGRCVNKDDKAALANDHLASQAMRVLAFACRKFDQLPQNINSEIIEQNLTFLGLMAMIDPPREEVKHAMRACKTAGIKTVMITGDHKNTAVAIAKELGFFHSDSLALTGEEMDKINDAEFAKLVEHVPVYARVSPEHKLRIVKAWRNKGEIVAMTGDGVNDAPAVKEADIGVAMGITGTDVTKEVSDMVVTDDNFASIVSAVEEGRGIYDNIKKFIHYLLSCNAGEILTMFVAMLLNLPVPLLPIHILWVNLVTDGLPALALGVDPVDKNIMTLPPRRSNETVVSREQAWIMLVQGAFIAFCSLTAFAFVMYIEKEGIMRARTAAFIVLSCSQLFHAFNCRSMRESLFQLGVFTNKKLIAAVLISFVLQMAVVYVPFFQAIFKTEALGLLDWVFVLIVSSLPLWAMEIYKAVVRADSKQDAASIRKRKARRGFWRMLYIKLVRLNDTPPRIAIGFGLGVFIGNMPGIGPIAALVTATIVRVNKVAAVLGAVLVNTWFGIITFIPGVKLGCFIMDKEWHEIHESWKVIIHNKDILSFFKASALDVLLPVLLGQFIISLIIGLIAWGVALSVLYGIKERKRRIREKAQNGL